MSIHHVTVWEAGTAGYHTYRIPSVIRVGSSLLAFCEGRRSGRGDSGKIDLLLKRSRDGGATWSEQEVLWSDGDNTCGNPCPVVDQSTGHVWLALTHNLGVDSEAQIRARTSRGTRTVWMTRSRNLGETWETPWEITGWAKSSDWRWYATGPGVGIQTRSGRLVIPCDHSGSDDVFRSHVIYSDDHGRTWRRGAPAGDLTNECQVVERRDGALVLNMRSYHGKNRRAIAVSRNQGESWDPLRLDSGLVDPVCQAGLVAMARPEAEPPLWLFSNPASVRRERMTIRWSPDEGRTWEHERLLASGPAAYSCPVDLGGGQAGCLFEMGTRSPYERIVFARFSVPPIRN